MKFKTSNQTALRYFMICIIAGLLWYTISVTPLLAQEGTRANTQTGNATYSVQFTATWSAETHPHPDGDFPTASAHFSPLIGAIHHADVSFWNPGELASEGIEQVAESGATNKLREEIADAIADGTTLSVISGNGVASPGGTEIAEIEVRADFPFVTLVTMIAPSPDWFVGVRGASLLDEDDQWVTEKTFTLYPYDAGTDSGSDYISPNANTDPPELIRTLRNEAPFSDAPIGTFTFTRIDEPQFSVYMPVVSKQ